MKLKFVICIRITESTYKVSVSLKMKVVNKIPFRNCAFQRSHKQSYIFFMPVFQCKQICSFLWHVFLSAEAMISGTGVGSFLFCISTRHQGCKTTVQYSGAM